MQHNLGSALMQVSDYETAIRHLNKAVDLKPGQIESLCLLGTCYNKMSRAKEGLSFFEKALRLQPDHPDVRPGFADALINLGEMERAEQLIKASIAKGIAVARSYQSLSALKKFTADAPELAEVRHALAATDKPASEISPLHFAAAKMLNDAKHYDEAMHHFSVAQAEAGEKYDVARYERRVDALINLFSPQFMFQRKNLGVSSARPVFIVGMPRSGTTLTEQIISSHAQAAGAGELPDISGIARQLGDNSKTLARFSEKLLTLDAAGIAVHANAYLNRLNKTSRDADRVTDKMPHNFEHVGLIALLFPNATIIHCKRDAIDNCMSIYMNAFSEAHGYSADFGKLGRYYRAYDRLMQHWHKLLPNRILDSQYEALVDDLEGNAKKLIAHCNLPWDEGCLNYTQNDRTVTTISRWQVRQPIYKTSVKRWKPYEKHIGKLIASLGDLADVS